MAKILCHYIGRENRKGCESADINHMKNHYQITTHNCKLVTNSKLKKQLFNIRLLFSSAYSFLHGNVRNSIVRQKFDKIMFLAARHLAEAVQTFSPKTLLSSLSLHAMCQYIVTTADEWKYHNIHTQQYHQMVFFHPQFASLKTSADIDSHIRSCGHNVFSLR